MPREKAVHSELKRASAAAACNSTNNDVRPRRPRERLKSSVLEELWSIWRTDPRVPSVKSRRSWAISRSANPRLVGHWFLRRRTCAKKAGQPIPDGSYDLSLDSRASIEPELEAVPDLHSDDTLVYPPDDEDLNDLEASSDTLFDEDTPMDMKRTETSAYREVHQQLRPNHYHGQQMSSSADLYADRFDEGTSLFETFPVCNQGWGKHSNFTCMLCSTESVQDTPVSDSGAIYDSRGNMFISCSCLDFFPGTLSELSAIPFLFRTPPTVPSDNAVSRTSVDSWTIVEDELGRLVNDGKLDFSFLDVSHLASMELLD